MKKILSDVQPDAVSVGPSSIKIFKLLYRIDAFDPMINSTTIQVLAFLTAADLLVMRRAAITGCDVHALAEVVALVLQVDKRLIIDRIASTPASTSELNPAEIAR